MKPKSDPFHIPRTGHEGYALLSQQIMLNMTAELPAARTNRKQPPGEAWCYTSQQVSKTSPTCTRHSSLAMQMANRFVRMVRVKLEAEDWQFGSEAQ